MINFHQLFSREMLIREDVDIQTSSLCIAEKDHKLNTKCC